MPEITALGFDYGSHWIGCAVGQSRTRTATPLEAVRARQFKPDWPQIARLIEIWQPDYLVVGLPTNLDSKEREVTRLAKRFANQLEGRYHLPVEMIDEHLTTREAWQIAEQSEARQRKPDIDSISAVLITESWLRLQKDS
jgi:putative Holliday junction resolvase